MTAKIGPIKPEDWLCSLDLPNENPRLAKKMPPNTPANNPTIPAIAVRSPPPNRK